MYSHPKSCLKPNFSFFNVKQLFSVDAAMYLQKVYILTMKIKNKKTHHFSKVGYFSKIAEVFNTSLMA
jgi:hypothetical protein